VDPVETRWLQRDGGALAYQVLGQGPPDVVHLWEINQHPDLSWTDPHLHALFEREAASMRSVHVQRRGFGLSDPVGITPTIEQQADDVLAVMDAEGFDRATLLGIFSTCGVAALVAARAPERVHGLVFLNPIAQGPLSTEEPVGWEAAELERFVSGWRDVFDTWGSGGSGPMWQRAWDTSYHRRMFALLERCSASPLAAQAYMEWALHIDLREVFRNVRVPTRVVYEPGGAHPEAAVRFVAELIQGATFSVLPPLPHGSSIGEGMLPVLQHVEQVAGGSGALADPARVLGTVLFTDVVASTELLARIGDAAYGELRASHERQVRLLVEAEGGRVASVSGDGTMSLFDGPVRAVRAAQAICASLGTLGLPVRAGIHTGELERRYLDVTGLTVHIAARVMAEAGPGQVLVSRTTRDLCAGSGEQFAPARMQVLRGVPGQWELFASTGMADGPAELPIEATAPEATTLDRAVVTMTRRAPSAVRAAMRLGNAVQRFRAARQL
jgi:class 3 adenylate cyclase/pimeloyl-ACP methyl ester carboxylesterase